MILLILIFTIAIVSMFIIAPMFIPLMHKLKFGQPIYELGPESHQAKNGTPTMGGLMFTAVSSLITFIAMIFSGTSAAAILMVVFSLLCMLIGFGDDLIKVKSKRNLGLKWWQKIIAQVCLGFSFSLFCYLTPSIGSSIIIPFFGIDWDLGFWYLPLMTLLIIFIMNSANLQDGLDGLLSSVAIIGYLAWSVIAFLFMVTSQSSDTSVLMPIIIFCLSIGGSLFAFLRFNFHPAKIFMGDTGSMFIGGSMVAVAMLLRLPILLILIAFTMIFSSISVIMQRIYFKATKGKRIFKMSPIHHHFEKSGMTEPQIVVMYAAVTGVLSVIAILSLSWI